MRSFLGVFAFLLGIGSLFGQTGPGGIGNGAGILELWLDGKDVNGNGSNPANGAAVFTWYDKSGNGRNVTQNTAGVATYSTAGNGVVFKALGYLSRSDAGLPAGNSARSLFVVASSPNTAIDDPIFFYGTTVNGQACGLLRRGGSGDIRSFFHGAPDLDYADGWGGTAPLIINTTYAGGVHRMYVNGPQVAFQNRTPNTVLGQGLEIGGWSSYSNLYSEATVKEVILFSNVLNNAQKVIVENYLSAKYNIALASTDFFNNNVYTLGVQGIGTSDGTAANTHSQSASSGGLELETSGTTFNAANEYVFAGYAAANNSVLTTDLTGTVQQRWQRIWYLDKTGNVNAQLSFNFATSGIGGTPAGSNYVLLHRSGTTGAFSTVTSALSVVGSKVTFTVTNANLADGYYTIGTTAADVSPLPVTFVDFTAYKENNNVQIKWQTSSEINNASFTVERSKDMTDWNILTQIKGGGTSTSEYFYSAKDERPYGGTSYYRIKQTDFNGQNNYTDAVSVHFESEDILISPNPSNGMIMVNGYFNSLSVYNSLGELILLPHVTKENGISLDLSHLPIGVYTISFVKVNGDYVHHKVVVQR